MTEAMGFRSKSQVESVVMALKAKGYVHYLPGQARSIVALDPMHDLSGFSTSDLARELARRLAS
jgi:SOS-response transcriptional repressor LexA